MRVVLDPGAYMPVHEHFADAGFDIRSMETKIVPAHGSAVFDTGVHIEIPLGFAGFLKSKSGLNVNHDITSEGVIDAQFQGSIKAKLYNHGDADYKVMAGDKITQIVFVWIGLTEMEQVDEFGYKTDRGDNGFGSTGK